MTTTHQDSIGDAFARGYLEWPSSFGLTYDDDSTSPRSIAYDEGRDLAERTQKPTAPADLDPGAMNDPPDPRDDALDTVARWLTDPHLSAAEVLAGIRAAVRLTGRTVDAEWPGDYLARPDHEPWNGNAYRLTLSASVEANTPDAAWTLAGHLLAGIPGAGHRAGAVSGPGSWAPDTRTADLIPPDAER